MANDIDILNKLSPVVRIQQIANANLAFKLCWQFPRVAAGRDTLDTRVACHSLDDVATQEAGGSGDQDTNSAWVGHSPP
jgi:hypothetical protein